MDPFGLEDLSAGSRSRTLPADYRHAVPGGYELSWLEDEDVLDFGDTRKPLGDLVLRSKRSGVGQTFGAKELPFNVVGYEI